MSYCIARGMLALLWQRNHLNPASKPPPLFLSLAAGCVVCARRNFYILHSLPAKPGELSWNCSDIQTLGGGCLRVVRPCEYVQVEIRELEKIGEYEADTTEDKLHEHLLIALSSFLIRFTNNNTSNTTSYHLYQKRNI